MLGVSGFIRRGALVMLTGSMLVAPTVAVAQDQVRVRFVHGVPGAGSAVLSAGGSRTAPVSFAEASDYVAARDGEVRLEVLPAGGGRALGRATDTLEDGRYTVVAARNGDRVRLRAYRDDRPRGGRASVRAIHAAPELGRVTINADGRAIAERLEPGDAGSSVILDPGSYELKAMRPGADDSLASEAGVNFVAGTSTSAVIVGGGGEALRFVLARSDGAAPAEAPATGLGGLDDGTPWGLAVLAALTVGLLGGVLYAAAWRRRRA